MDAGGFDVIPNIREIAFPEIRDYVRCGSLTEIPFSSDDAFDTLVAIDVLEHIPERDLPLMVKEWCRIGVRQLVLLINLNQFWFPGHITLRPLSWWSNCFQPHFRLDATVSRFPHLDATYSNTGAYNQAVDELHSSWPSSKEGHQCPHVAYNPTRLWLSHPARALVLMK